MPTKAVARESEIEITELDAKPTPNVVVRGVRPGSAKVSIHSPVADAPPKHDSWTLELTGNERRFLRGALDGLTPREREVVYEICSGGTNDAIADRLCVALPTLRTHLMRLNQKLGTTSKGDVVRFVACRLLWGYRNNQIPESAESSSG